MYCAKVFFLVWRMVYANYDVDPIAFDYDINGGDNERDEDRGGGKGRKRKVVNIKRKG